MAKQIVSDEAGYGPYLPIYLNDHLAGATGGLELSRRLCASNSEDPALAPTLRRMSLEIEADRVTLAGILDRLGVSRNPVKPAVAWMLERLGRLKPNGQLRGYSPLSRVLELEGLAIGIAGKTELWRTLGGLELEALASIDFAALARRAEEQHAAVAELHQIAIGAL